VNHINPAIVAQSAVRRLPRLALILFCVAYVLPGFLGREPWKLADVSAFGVMLEMATGQGSWWQPQVLGVPVDEAGPLPYWLGALFIRWLPFWSAEVAARVPFALMLALTLACTWYAAYHLARPRPAQPVAFAFGGEAQPVDYARSLADAALLALVASLGLAQLSHETTPDLTRLCAISALLLGAARLSNPEAPQPWRGLLIWSCAGAALAFSGGPWVALVTGGGLLVALRLHTREASDTPPTTRLLAPAAVALVLAAGVAGWAGLLQDPGLQWPTGWDAWQRWGTLLVWFTWPAWPLVLWTLWRWRRQLLNAHVVLPLWAALVSIGNSAFNPDFDRALLLALPALACLAAFALPTLSRSVSALIDWFTLLFFTGCALIVWIVWVAMMTGVPAKPAANVAKLAPGFVPEFSFGLFAVATLATLAWIWLVSWRVGAHRQALWKSLVLPAGGATLCWLLLMTLWLPLLDHGRSYGPVSRRVAAMVPAGSCVLVDGLSSAQIAALQYHGRLALVRNSAAAQPLADTGCRALVATPQSQSTLDQRLDLTQWAFRASVRRLNDRREQLLVYQRVGP
jgi:4-amino-4-deoxy-L-arabinose transferase-like glycosyltransferase